MLLLTVAFLLGNWHVFAAPASFSLLFGSVDLPIGVVMVVLMAVIITVAAIYVAIWQSSLLMDYRRQSKELQAQRTLADDAEASRFTALSVLVREEIGALRTELRDTEHSIAATLAEMDDRMSRTTPRSVI